MLFVQLCSAACTADEYRLMDCGLYWEQGMFPSQHMKSPCRDYQGKSWIIFTCSFKLQHATFGNQASRSTPPRVLNTDLCQYICGHNLWHLTDMHIVPFHANMWRTGLDFPWLEWGPLVQKPQQENDFDLVPVLLCVTGDFNSALPY